MKIIKAITLQFLVVVTFTSCNSFTSQPMIKPTNVTEASTSIVNTEVVRTLPGATSTTTPIAFETSTKTPLPVNTLTVPEREKFVRDTISGNPSCKLPCWWDITPGETTWKETEEFLQRLGVRIGAVPGYSPNAVFHGTGGFDFEGISINNGFSFEETNGIIDAILIRSDGYNNLEKFQTLWKDYSPKRILEAYGPPDRIWLNVTEVYASARGYHLWFFYDEMGFMIRYPGDVVDTPVLHICPVIEGMRAIDLSLQASDSPLPLERFDAILEDIWLQTETGKTRGLHSIQDATGLDEKQFYDAFIQEDLACFDTPQDIWTVK
jgi:hypothetical protein